MNPCFESLKKIRIIPVVKIQDAAHAEPLAQALLEGGIPCAEITFRTEAAMEALRVIAKLGKLLVGAGTVFTIDQAQAALDAGATYLVSPGFNPSVVEYCLKHEIPIIPGVATPTEIALALEYGLEVLKFFPAEAFGGLKTLKALSAPYGQVQFIPTGGISPHNLAAYLQFPQVLACGGSWMVKPDFIAQKDFASIVRLSQEAVALAHGATVDG